MRVCAGIVLFHPDMGRLKKNIDSVLPQVDKLILVNNAPEDADMLDAAFPAGSGNTGGASAASNASILRIDNDRNLGIAAALNQILTAADDDGFGWVLTLDQDSVCAEDLVEKLLAAAKEYGDAAMISPRIIENGSVWEDKSRSRGRQIEGRSSQCADIEEVAFCITSGTLTGVKAVLNAGGFNERLFIDEVDSDMCIRLRYRGHRLLRVNSTELFHEFGQELVRRRILFKVYEYRNYSPFRVYYQLRNMVYMIRKYGADYKPYPAWRLIRPFFTFFVKFLLEPQRLKRLSAFVRGYAAGLVMKL